MDFNYSVIFIAPDDPQHSHVAYPRHNFVGPGGMKIRNFDDYFRAFYQWIFTYNNSDLFITLFGLAYAINMFINQIDWNEYESFEDLFPYKPLTHTLNNLVHMGALHNPFDKKASWKFCLLGIENAQELCPDLTGALETARAMTPLVQLSPFETPDVMQIFFGLINHFPSTKDYFGIDYNAQFIFPSL